MRMCNNCKNSKFEPKTILINFSPPFEQLSNLVWFLHNSFAVLLNGINILFFNYNGNHNLLNSNIELSIHTYLLVKNIHLLHKTKNYMTQFHFISLIKPKSLACRDRFCFQQLTKKYFLCNDATNQNQYIFIYII